MRGVAWWLAALLGLGIAASALAYWFSPQIARAWLTYMASSTVSDLRLTMRRPGLSSLHICSLSFTYGDYSVAASAIDLHYSIAELWVGRVSALHVETLAIASRRSRNATFEVVPVLPGDLWPLVPADRVVVDAVSLEGLPVAASGSFSMDATGADAYLTADRRYEVEVRIERSGTFAASVADPAGSSLEARGTFPGVEQFHVTLEGTLNTRSLTPWIDFGETAGTLTMALDLRVALNTLATDFDGALGVAGNRIPFSGSFDVEDETASVGLHRRFDVAQPFRHHIGGSARQQIEAAGDLTVDIKGGRRSESGYWMETRARLGDGHVRVGTVSAHGISMDATLLYGTNQPMVGEVTLATEAIETGLPIRSVSASASLQHVAPLRVHVSSVMGEVLGGAFYAADFDFDAEDDTVLELHLNGLDVAEVLALQGTPLTGTGTLDGLVPVTIVGRQVTVNGGEVLARPPGGSLRYPDATTLPLADPTRLDTALAALKDFRYDRLGAKLDYGADGTLALGVRLEGRNPKMQQGRLVHFNANVVQHLPSLLRSLQVASTLDHRVAEYFETTSP